MSIKNEEELEGLKAAGHAVAATLKKMKEFTQVGMSTREIDDYGGELLAEFGAMSAPIKDYDFPGHTCISINHVACHGIPSEELILKEGDLVNIDVSAELNGYYGDNGGSFVVGEDIHNHRPLITASQEILKMAIENIRDGVRISNVGGLIEKEARKRGFQVIKNLCGHGIGRKLHEPPTEIANYRDRFNTERFKKNSVIALETFISTKSKYVHQQADGWTMMTKDKSFVTQHEHTLVITDGFPIILTEGNGVFEF